MTILISDNDVKKILTLEETIAAAEDAYRQYGKGLAGGNSLMKDCPIIPRSEMRVEGKSLPHLSPEIRYVSQDMAYLEETGKVFLRWNFYLGDKRAGISYLIDAKNGEILAVIKAPTMWTMRVGAVGAVGAKYLARKDSKIAGILGTGRVGRIQLEAVSKIRNIEKAFAYSGRRKNEEYANTMSKKLGIEIIACDTAEQVVRNADILIASTASVNPIVKGEWINKGLHINAFGADCPWKSELDASTITKADKLVIDYELALETKELHVPIEQGLINENDIYGTIGEIVAGIKPGRESPQEFTIFKNTGMPIPYVTISTKVYEKAVENGLGTEIDASFSDLIY
jgi:alanine dehydrogenase